MKKTTYYYFCQAIRKDIGGLSKAREYFSHAPIQDKNRICTMLINNIHDISDVEQVRYFTDSRLEYCKDQLRLMAICQADKL